PLRPDEALGERRLQQQERAGDLAGREAAERAQRQGHLRLQGERRVAAREEQLEALVGERRGHGRRRLPLEQRQLRGERPLAPDPVDRAVAGGDREPGAGVRRDAVARPPFGGDRERLLGGRLGEVEVAEEADQGGEDAAQLVAEGLLEGQARSISTTGRTSTLPPRRAAGIRAATSRAASRSSTSIR